MGTIPTPPTFVAGAVLTAAGLNSLRDVLNFWAGPPQCSALHSTLISIPDNVYTLIPLQSEEYDIVQAGDSPMHDNTTNNSRIYFRTPGKYQIVGQVTFASNATGRRTVKVKLNSGGVETAGTEVIYSAQSAVSGTGTSVPLPPKTISVSAGDYIEMFAVQTSGAALNSNAASSGTFLQARLIST